MHNDLTELFRFQVEPFFRAYLRALTTNKAGQGLLLRSAEPSVSSLFHFREHFNNLEGTDFTVKQIEQKCPAYRLIGNVCNTLKHHKIDKNNPIVKDIEQITEGIRITFFEDEEGLFSYDETIIDLRLGLDNHVDLLKIISEVLNFWGQMLHESDWLDRPFFYHYEGDKIYTREAIPKTNTVTLIATVKKSVTFCTIMRNYNARTGNFELAKYQEESPGSNVLNFK